MNCRRISLNICILVLFVSCIAMAQEKPDVMFNNLFEKYSKTKYETRTLSQLGEGAGIFIFDINKELSPDVFCQINLYSSLGQTQYRIYKKSTDDVWYFYKKATFYEAPFMLEGAENVNTYFKFVNAHPFVFNPETNKYDIQADTNEYQAIVDFRSLIQIIEVIHELDIE